MFLHIHCSLTSVSKRIVLNYSSETIVGQFSGQIYYPVRRRCSSSTRDDISSVTLETQVKEDPSISNHSSHCHRFTAYTGSTCRRLHSTGVQGNLQRDNRLVHSHRRTG